MSYTRPVRATILPFIAALTLQTGCELSELRPGAQSIMELSAPPSPQEAAQWAIDPYDPNNRYRGTLLLANAPFAGEEVYLRLFEDNIDDADPGVRAAACRALANHGNASHMPLLTGALSDAEVGVRFEAARGLQRVYAPEAIDPLIKSLSPATEPEYAVRAEVACALGQYREARVAEALIASLDDPHLAVNRATLDSLRVLTGQDLGYERRDWVVWFNESPTPFAAGGVYVYPVFSRSKFWYEHLPFIPPPPNEVAGTPAGMPVRE